MTILFQTWRWAFLPTFFGPNSDFFAIGDKDYKVIVEMIYQLMMLSRLTYSEIYNLPVDKRTWLYNRTVRWHNDKNEEIEKAYKK